MRERKGAYTAEDILTQIANGIPMHTAEKTNADSEGDTVELETLASITRLSRYGRRQSVGPVGISGAHYKVRLSRKPKYKHKQARTPVHCQLVLGIGNHTHNMRANADGIVFTTTKINVIATDTLGMGEKSATTPQNVNVYSSTQCSKDIFLRYRCSKFSTHIHTFETSIAFCIVREIQLTALNQDEVTGRDPNDPVAERRDGNRDPDIEFRIE
ncbi:hypothetical protein SARC_00392 [Sphaeroforma arctica JP610]|uniref:Uncharacterized protein n=1 Tax=Sphaeroforma arctica JP610 TaxID=667725 RepID=A0A0L0GER5_9EUKA|nr:hypothetical protein SARC_00392 [Sphaeroforma arctica JP610]KNC87507.1 hypothetical protein SARC_00392 [Sphaeroforma arctica JP610]|eukprot:XP_014161409.1 hypothetical protein SARC_00392 [Sphaeroforma arctica JP610]